MPPTVSVVPEIDDAVPDAEGFPAPADPEPLAPPPDPPDPPFGVVSEPPAPPPAEVIVEKIELDPCGPEFG